MDEIEGERIVAVVDKYYNFRIGYVWIYQKWLGVTNNIFDSQQRSISFRVFF